MKRYLKSCVCSCPHVALTNRFSPGACVSCNLSQRSLRNCFSIAIHSANMTLKVLPIHSCKQVPPPTSRYARTDID